MDPGAAAASSVPAPVPVPAPAPVPAPTDGVPALRVLVFFSRVAGAQVAAGGPGKAPVGGKSGLHRARMPANCRRGRPQGTVPQKADRAPGRALSGAPTRGARVKACGKSARIAAETSLSANPIRSKVVSQVQAAAMQPEGGPSEPAGRPLEATGNGGPRRMVTTCFAVTRGRNRTRLTDTRDSHRFFVISPSTA